MSQFIFTQLVPSTYKKAYQQHYDKLFPLHISKKVQIEDHTYVLVGQWKLKESPLLSDFDVFDESGMSANEFVGQKIHDYIAILSLAKGTFDKLQEPLSNHLQETIQSAHLKEALPIEDEEVAILSKSLEATYQALNELIDVGDALFKKEQWDEKDIIALERKWDVFLKAYEPRAQLLLNVYDHIKQQRERPSFEGKSIKSLWKETEVMYDAFTLLSPLGAETGSMSMNELIMHNYRYGRFKQSDPPMEKENKLGRGLY